MTMKLGGHVTASSIEDIAAYEAQFNLNFNQCSEGIKQLSRRQFEILRAIAGGKRSAQIAEVLGISLETVRTCRLTIYQKLGCDSPVGVSRRFWLVDLCRAALGIGPLTIDDF
jgi:DNA-binding CsgD family transcriptional regulator